ncbi:hypothetical protein A2U01_0010544 [Trifolium medium]|uniref:Uncharacterized protein n=1 Tax=Trifolium medium TaxID=97028 RepID=A0A392MTP9_9FABA|nr:hypothetical protein [Trifolium medium]
MGVYESGASGKMVVMCCNSICRNKRRRRYLDETQSGTSANTIRACTAARREMPVRPPPVL